MLKRLPWILASTNLGITLYVCMNAFSDPTYRFVLMFIYVVDFPASVLAIWIDGLIVAYFPQMFANPSMADLVFCIVLMVVGSFWFFLVGVALRYMLSRGVARVQRLHDHIETAHYIRHRGLCKQCGYDLRAHLANPELPKRCPECGTPISNALNE